MSKCNSEFDLPFNINTDTQYYWEAFIRQTKSGSPLAAINAYHEYRKAKEIAFKESVMQKEGMEF